MKYRILFKLVLILMIPKLGCSQTLDFFTSDRLVLGTLKERTASIDVGDIDNDGDQDLLVANGRHWPGQNRVFLNNGDGLFTISRQLGSQRDTSYSTELGDFDNDGDLDVAVGNDRAPNFIFINDGNGYFSKGISFGERNSTTRNIIVSDIDKDGHLDILITNRRAKNEICINDGSGLFNCSKSFGSKKDFFRAKI